MEFFTRDLYNKSMLSRAGKLTLEEEEKLSYKENLVVENYKKHLRRIYKFLPLSIQKYYRIELYLAIIKSIHKISKDEILIIFDCTNCEDNILTDNIDILFKGVKIFEYDKKIIGQSYEMEEVHLAQREDIDYNDEETFEKGLDFDFDYRALFRKGNLRIIASEVVYPEDKVKLTRNFL